MKPEYYEFNSSRGAMMIAEGQQTGIRYALGGLLAFGALNAFAGGCYGMTGAEGVPHSGSR